MKKLLISILFLMSINLNAQQLQQHHWKNRLLLIVDQTDDISKTTTQLSKLQQDIPGLKERKLLVYQFSNKGYKKGLSDTYNWQPTTSETAITLSKNPTFTVYLIGLDGGIKMKKHKVVNLSTIFSLIDGMPMRRAELRGQ